MPMVMRSVRRSERMRLALSLVHALCEGVTVCHPGGVWWLLLAPPQQQVTLCSPALLPPGLLHHSLPVLPLSLCYIPHLHRQLVVAVWQHQCRYQCGGPDGWGEAEVTRREPCRIQTDLDGWWKTCESKQKRQKMKKKQGIFRETVYRWTEKSRDSDRD